MIKYDFYILYGEIYHKDDWYGKNYRVVLMLDKDKFFKFKKHAKNFQSLFKKYCKKYFESFKDKYNENISITYKIKQREDVKTYEYCGAGPSYHCIEEIITVRDLINWANNLR
jgi:hypothetical protein